ncbi:MAG TPA: hypothetical protein VF403_28065, partial [Kofleriaceae bacterium]
LAFVDASRRKLASQAWLAPELVVTDVYCDTKKIEALYAWLWLDAASFTWPTQHTCNGECCEFTATPADGASIDGVARRVCASGGKIREIHMRCGD